MSVEYEPIRAADSTPSSGRSMERALPVDACGALTEAEVAGDAPRRGWLLLVGLVWTCVIAVFGSAHHGLTITRQTERCTAAPGSSMKPTSAPPQQDGWVG